MKSLYLVLFTSFITLFSIAQNIDTIYYNKSWAEIVDKSQATYYKTIQPFKDSVIVKGHFINGQKQMDAVYQTTKMEIAIGEVRYYYSTGEIKAVEQWENSDIALQKWYFPNGNLKSQGGFKEGRSDGEWIYKNSSGKIISEGSFIKGLKDGIWKIYSLDGELLATKIYELTLLKEIILVDNKNKLFYEYEVEIDDFGKESITPFMLKGTSQEYKLYEEFMRNNLDYIKKNPTDKLTDILTFYTQLWVSSCPYYGKFIIMVNKFIYDYTSFQDYKYKRIFNLCLIAGNCNYFIDKGNKEYDKSESQLYIAEYMAETYNNLIHIDPSAKHDKFDVLLKKYNSGKLKKFMNNYK
ncbi:MAG: hypothetical protein K9J13_07700 [Saprospiraceae bacterium]|nr:hypothetical protein [Saprospiraceae bacterium]